jgi:hypothetical protein
MRLQQAYKISTLKEMILRTELSFGRETDNVSASATNGPPFHAAGPALRTSSGTEAAYF